MGGAARRSIETAALIGDRIDLQPNALAGGNVDLAAYNKYSIAELDDQISLIREIEARSGRQMLISELPFLAVTRNMQDAKVRRQQLAATYGIDAEVMDRSLGTIVGCAEEAAERLSAYADAGCDRVNLQSLDDTSPARFAPQLPHLRKL